MNARTFSICSVFFLVIQACSSSAPDDPSVGDDGETGTASDALSLCNPAKCGPPLGMATVLCSDGSTGGSTGRCVRKSPRAACGWEVRACPPGPPTPPPPVPVPAPCSAKGACGPQLGMPNHLCEDGKTIAGPGACVDKGGVCGWEIISCPVPPPPPPIKCAPGACGPALGMPNYLCKDGKTVAGPGACVDKGGVCGWEIISCP